MNIFKRIFSGEKRATTSSTSDPYLAEFFNQGSGISGYVDKNRASGLAVGQACINAIAPVLASMPMHLYRRTGNGGREKAKDHPLYEVLHNVANPHQNAFEVREYLLASLLINGNAFAQIVWNGRGQVTQLVPIEPSSVTVERLENGRLRYRIANERGNVHFLLQDEILHLRYRLDRNGIMGLSPIQLARETFNLALCQQDISGTQASKGNRPEGVLTFPDRIGAAGKDNALTALQDRIQNTSSTGGILVLDGGATWNPMAFSSKDAEFLESRKLSNLDVCRIWGVPPTVAGITDNATYSNVDGESRALVVRCLAPMARRVEQAMNTALLPAMARKNMFVEHDLSGLLRGDQKARYEAYRIGREWGWLSPNEIRAWENLPQIENGEEYLSPLNMAPLGAREATAE